MKRSKLFGMAFAAVVAFAVTAHPGPALGHATLCKVSTSPCPEASRYQAGETMVAKAATVTLTSSAGTVFCSSEMKISLSSVEGTGSITSFQLTGCKREGWSPCMTTEARNLPYQSQFNVVASGPNGIWKAQGLELDIQCDLLSCTFSKAVLEVPVLGGTAAAITINGVELKPGSGFICPASMKLDATFTVSNLWVRALP